MPAGSEALAGRYGDTARRRLTTRWLLVGLGGFIAIVMIAWAVWGSGLGSKASNLQFTATASNTIDAQHITVSFTVDAPAHTAISCAVEAQNIGFTVVGYDVVHLKPTPKTHQVVTKSLITYEPAVSGSLDKCWLT
ncbi:DUF4307 domain-containing protein [Gryllotalpicola protaetiae]|uniref:DUF4307 domain-containing protein n=1 Tax=Gryllotalpicola protaetiae TaxID=2419771 RepID=A0A387BIT5_9MICO|nr:DUF4307 domain-containing protein [Gryllotalpicola protaetiae]AYG02598.1 DUF4307 domain-containing protein [Gryllotalpicola protaetiae]